MQSRFSQAFIHALMVGAHILVAILVIGAYYYGANNQGQFITYLTKFGVPVGVANMVIAGVVKYLETHQPTPLIIDTAPPIPPSVQ